MTGKHEQAHQRPAEFDAKIVAYLPHLRRLAHRFERDPVKREDLVADTVAAALGKAHSFRVDGSFAMWLYWLMRGIRSDQRKKVNREVLHADGLYADRARTMATQEDAAAVSEAMSRVPARYVGVMTLVANGWTTREIAQTEGVTHQAISLRLARARASLTRSNARAAA